MASAKAAAEDQELVADELAAPANEDTRMHDYVREVLLAGVEIEPLPWYS